MSHTLVNYHFGSVDGLLAEALALGISPRDVVRAATTDGETVDLHRLVRGLLALWEHPVLGPRLAVLARRIAAGEASAAPLVGYLERVVFGALSAGLDRERAERATIAVVGTVFARYILRLDAATALSRAQLERLLLSMIGQPS